MLCEGKENLVKVVVRNDGSSNGNGSNYVDNSSYMVPVVVTVVVMVTVEW